MSVLVKSPTSSKIGHVWAKTRSLGQILEKSYVPSRGHIFSRIVIKLGQNVCLDQILNESKNGYVWSKIRPLGQVLDKPCVHSRGYIFSPIIMKLGQNVCLDEILDNSVMGHVGSITRSNFVYALEATSSGG